jgi:hypothetical protein
MYSFIETRLFSRLVAGYLSDQEYSRLQDALVRDPEAGSVIPGSGGVRKLRWGRAGQGKRGGMRFIYYLKRRDGVIWMLTIYAKSEASDIPASILRRIKDEIDDADQP